MKSLALLFVLACVFAVYGQQTPSGATGVDMLWNDAQRGYMCSRNGGDFRHCTPEDLRYFGLLVDKQAIIHDPGPWRIEYSGEPFDVAPQEWATYESRPLTHWGCADPRRALITTEDGVKHCYGFFILSGK